MAITLSEMLKKAKDKGIQPTSDVKDKPWYDGSVIKEKNNKPTTKKQQTENSMLATDKHLTPIVTNWEKQQQTNNKEKTNRKQNVTEEKTSSHQQTTNKQVSNPLRTRAGMLRTNQQQRNNKQKTKREPEKNIKPAANYQQTGIKPPSYQSGDAANKLTTKKQQPSEQITDAVIANQYLFENIVGLQRVLFVYIISACVENNLPKTKPLFINDFADISKTDIKTIKTSLYRLEKKQIIFRDKFKNGRGGWTIYGLPQITWEKINEILG